MKNNGKRFESNFKNSVPNEILYYRFKDGTGWAGGETRFQCSNICDCLLYDDGHNVICWLSDEYYNKSMFDTESARIARLGELMAKCPLEVVE